MKYKIRLWCRDCFEEDPQGCFDGGYGYVYDDKGDPKEFDSVADAQTAGWNEVSDCGPWEFDIVDEQGNKIDKAGSR